MSTGTAADPLRGVIGDDHPGPAMAPVELADTIVNRIFAVSIDLRAAAETIEEPARRQLERAVAELDDLIREVRLETLERIVGGARSAPDDSVDAIRDGLRAVRHLLGAAWIDAATGVMPPRVDVERLVEASRHTHRAIAAVTEATVT